MTCGERLRDRRDAIAQRWYDAMLATYPEGAHASLNKRNAPFTNPVGHSLQTGAQSIVNALIADDSIEGARPALHDIVQVRAIQQFSAAEALEFVFALRDAIRAELGPRVDAADLAELDRRVDRLALFAFEDYVECRQRVCDLRVNEIKRTVAWTTRRMNQGA